MKHYDTHVYDVIIIGGGHAGAEAAYAAARMGTSVLLLTGDKNKIAAMHCNPSVGGLGKGHIVYEMAAFGGLMPKVCSDTYLQARMLNTSKGPAVQGLRLQIDKYAYVRKIQNILENTQNLDIESGIAAKLLIDEVDGKKIIAGVETTHGQKYYGKAVVIATGVFLNSKCYVGDTITHSGPEGRAASLDLSASLADALGTQLGRLRTGTPARIKRESIDFSKLEHQPAHNLPYLFEYREVPPVIEKMPCFIAHTTDQTHQVIKDYFYQSAVSKNLDSFAPRYCPSIDEKVRRYPDRDAHHVFVEPESGECDEIYPAGLSTSLEHDIQEKFMRTIPGFENCVISKYAYAIEYDFLQPNKLYETLETKAVKGLFCAGQINGTTGYEEAAGQGMVAGINASLSASGKDPFVLSRSESYIGVMLNDIMTLGVNEPYRMFTSRAEHRLILRQDNVFARLMPYARNLGLCDDATWAAFEKEEALVKKALVFLAKGRLSSNSLFKAFFTLEFNEPAQQLAQSELELALGESIIGHGFPPARLLLRVHAEVRYDGYIQKEEREAQKLKDLSTLKIPADFVFDGIAGLSIELTEKLKKASPSTIADASIIPGMTPAALSILIFKIKKPLK